MKSIKIIILNNFVAMLMVFWVGAANFALGLNISSISGLLDLSTGARLGALLLFGLSSFPGILAGTLLVSAFYLDPTSMFAGIATYNVLAEACAPFVALLAMQQFKLSSFYTAKGFYYPHVLFLCILTALFTSFSRFLVVTSAKSSLPEMFNFSSYMGSIFLTDLLGALMFFMVLIFVATAFVEHLDQIKG